MQELALFKQDTLLPSQLNNNMLLDKSGSDFIMQVNQNESYTTLHTTPKNKVI